MRDTDFLSLFAPTNNIADSEYRLKNSYKEYNVVVYCRLSSIARKLQFNIRLTKEITVFCVSVKPTHRLAIKEPAKNVKRQISDWSDQTVGLSDWRRRAGSSSYSRGTVDENLAPVSVVVVVGVRHRRRVWSGSRKGKERKLNKKERQWRKGRK
jgi:hypothetical protein